jgi:hypothetical protein
MNQLLTRYLAFTPYALFSLATLADSLYYGPARKTFAFGELALWIEGLFIAGSGLGLPPVF